jgi:hypothetical protein
LKLEHNESLSNFAFKINLRRYNVARRCHGAHAAQGGAAQVDPIKTRVESAYGYSA